MELVELNKEEMQRIEGGWVAFAGLLVACFALGNEIGKNAAQRARQ